MFFKNVSQKFLRTFLNILSAHWDISDNYNKDRYKRIQINGISSFNVTILATPFTCV